MTRLFRLPAFQWAFTATICFLGAFLAPVLVGALAPALFWPPAGLALGAAVLWGGRVIPAAVLGTFLGTAAQGAGGAEAAWLGLSVAAQAGLGWFLLRRAGVSRSFSRLGDLFRLFLHGGFLAGLAAVPLAHSALSDVDGFWTLTLSQQVLTLLMSQLAGVVVFAPLVLCWWASDCPRQLMRRVEVGLALLGLGLCALLLAHPELVGLPGSPIRPYPLLPFLLWLALRSDARLVALGLAWAYAVMSSDVVADNWELVMLPDGQWVWPLHGFITMTGASFLSLAILMGTNRRLELAHLADTLAQRDALIREVHHRIKNNLQTVVGLLRRDAAKHPEARPMLESAINQVQSIAVVHGLHGRVSQHGVRVCELLPAICRSVSELSGVQVAVSGIPEGCGDLRIQENETVALALVLNELVSNAVKHLDTASGLAGPSVSLVRDEGMARVSLSNPGRLPPGFDFAEGKGLGTGLGLVRALLPTPGVDLDIRQERDRVRVDVRIRPPVLATAT